MTWWQWVITGAACTAGIRALWLIVEELVDARRAYPVLMEIAEQFRPDNGNTLHDRISLISVTQQIQTLRLDDISAQLELLITDKPPTGPITGTPQGF